MATKTFKIGLSDADKSQMASSITSAIETMLFSAYDSTNTYNQGDYCIYGTPYALYRCKEDNVSGAWNSVKWEQATLQMLVDDVNDAVDSVDNKANVDGNYPTMTVGLADNLTPYDEDSGDDQDEPFSFQATGTGNGTQPDFATGSYALMKEKQGNTVCVNQLVNPSDLVTGNYNDLTRTRTDDVLTINGTIHSADTPALYYKNVAVISGHKYLLLFGNKLPTDVRFIVVGAGSSEYLFVGDFNNPVDRCIVTPVTTGNGLQVNLSANNDVALNNYKFIYKVIDLTQWFNGDIPSDLLSHPENFFRYYQGSLAYNAGTLVNANSQYIKCIGMNQWDEEWEIAGGTQLKSSNLIKVVPNTLYYAYCGTNASAYLKPNFYDETKTYIGTTSSVHNSTFTTPSNCQYIEFYMNADYSITYNNDISINLYYEDEARCLTYEPYEVLTNTDTGTETLRSAGSVKDTKTPDGTITRKVGYVDLGSLSWSYTNATYPRFQSTSSPTGIKVASDIYTKGNIVCGKYITAKVSDGYNGLVTVCITLATDGTIWIYDPSAGTNGATFKTAMSGVYLFYELAEPTVEQGTAFSPNLIIDDFGTMSFEGTNGVPQGNVIFYPVDYKAFTDTLYKYTEGTPSKLALKTEVQNVETISKQNLGGILRHMISGIAFANTDYVDLGTLTYLYDSTNHYFYAQLPQAKNTDNATNFLCSKYDVIAGNDMASQLASSDKIVCISTYLSSTNNLIIKDTSYSDVDTFTQAMNGILLAYEKA